LVVATGVWVLYRIVRGWLALSDDRPIEWLPSPLS
jgi:uncharacterized membrane protein